MAAPVRSAPVLLRALTIGVELVLGLSAVYGGIGLLTGTIGMPDTWLEGTVFGSWFVPGAALLLLVAVPMLVAAALEVRDSAYGVAASAAACLLQVVWVAAELLFMHRYDPLQPLVLGLAAVVLAAVGLRPLADRRPRRGPGARAGGPLERTPAERPVTGTEPSRPGVRDRRLRQQGPVGREDVRHHLGEGGRVGEQPGVTALDDVDGGVPERQADRGQ